jgi:NAD(P)-dependent dehydrogenase (short-subunit alcohol dehydrogenase family)
MGLATNGRARLAGKVAIVTGAATGLGREIAELYAAEGAQVVVADVRGPDGDETVAAIREAGGEAVFARTDVTKTADVRAAVETAEREFGRLDVMTANAGMLGRGAYDRLEDIAEEDFEQVMAVNLNGVFYAFKHAIPAIRRAGGGVMTATASVGAYIGGGRIEAYSASKAAVVALVRALAGDLMEDGIRVNAVAPGSIVTDFGKRTAELRGDPDFALPIDPNRKPIPRAQPRQIAEAHLFLASADASFVTGSTLVADGGWSSLAYG